MKTMKVERGTARRNRRKNMKAFRAERRKQKELHKKVFFTVRFADGKMVSL